MSAALLDALGDVVVDGALCPRSPAELADVVRRARAAGVALRPPGGADGEVAIDLARMRGILGIDDTSGLVHAWAGTTVAELDQTLRASGLTLGLQDAPDEALGAWLARGAPGARRAADDPVSQLVAGLTAILPDGRALAIRPAPRRAVGPDLIGAMIGARGRLGVVTSAHLLVRPRPSTRDLAFRFETAEAAEVARAWIRGRGVRPAATALEGAALWVRLEASSAELLDAYEAVAGAVAAEHGGEPVPDAPFPAGSDAEPPESPIVASIAGRL